MPNKVNTKHKKMDVTLHDLNDITFDLLSEWNS